MSIKLYIPSNHLATSWNCPLLAYKERLLTVSISVCQQHEHVKNTVAYTCWLLSLPVGSLWLRRLCESGTLRKAAQVIVRLWISHTTERLSDYSLSRTQSQSLCFEESLWVICLCDVVKLQLLVSVKGRARLSGLELRKNSLWDPSFACTEI